MRSQPSPATNGSAKNSIRFLSPPLVNLAAVFGFVVSAVRLGSRQFKCSSAVLNTEFVALNFGSLFLVSAIKMLNASAVRVPGPLQTNSYFNCQRKIN